MKSYFSLTIVVLMLVTLPVLAQNEPDEIEPNDTRDQATEMTVNFINGEIGVDGDVEDWYTFTLSDTDLVYGFSLSYTLAGRRVDLEVYSDENVIGTSVTGEHATVFCTVPGTCYIRVLATEGQGPYMLAINPPMEIFHPTVKPLACGNI